MNDIRINGKGTFAGGEYETVIVNGIAQCDGDLKARVVNVDGKFKNAGRLTAGTLDCDGMAEIQSDISAQNINVDGYLTVSDGTKIEAEKIECDGSIHVKGQISADEVQVDGYIRAREIVGDRVVIKSGINRLAKLIFKDTSEIELIEATTLDLRGVTVQTVNGRDINIGPGCKIENLDCSGTLKIDSGSTVANITGNYTQL